MLLVRRASPKIKTMEYFLPYNIRCFRQFLIHIEIITAVLLLPSPVSALGYGPCKDLCEKHRPRGWSGEYELNCDKIALQDQLNCERTCDDCPDDVCQGFSGSIFKCPGSEIVDYRCKQPCDKRSGVFKCTQGSYTVSELQDCQQYQCPQCPDWVCNKNAFAYFCPVDKDQSEDEEICQRNCHLRRFDKYDSEFIGEFEFSCTDFSYPEDDRCRQDCREACPNEICNSRYDENRYNCPALAERPKTTPKPERKYGGRCKDRCDKWRLAGKDKYSFHCNQVFSSEGGKDKCNSDCKRCPSEICSYSENSVFGSKFNCPTVDGFVDEEEQDKQRREENQAERSKKRATASSSLLIGVIFLVISVFLCCGCSCFYCCTRPTPAPPAANVTPGIGVTPGISATPNAVYSGQGMMNPQPPSYTNSQASTINPSQHSNPVSQMAL